MRHWRQYVDMTARHTGYQIKVVDSKHEDTRRELQLFEPALARGRQQVEDAQ